MEIGGRERENKCKEGGEEREAGRQGEEEEEGREER